MTIDQFKTVNPGSSFINILYKDISGTPHITAVTVATTDCTGNNIADVLIEIQTLTLSILGGITTLPVVLREPLSGYYFLKVQDTPRPNITLAAENICTSTYTNPSTSDTGFTKSEYQALLNNAETGKTTSYIFDVDRRKLELNPVNIDLINTGNALPAAFQELNYSSIGITNSRYNGAKTNSDQYGLISAVGVSLFDGAVFQGNIDNDSICSQSFQEREIKEYAFDSKDNKFPSGDTIPTASFNYFSIDGVIYGTEFNEAEVTATQTTFVAQMRKAKVQDYQAGDIIILTTGISAASEFAQIESITYLSPYNLDKDNYSILISRNIDGPSSTITGIPSSDYNINIIKVHSDILYTFEGNKIIPLSDRKVYIPLTGQILKTIKKGKVIRVEKICS